MTTSTQTKSNTTTRAKSTRKSSSTRRPAERGVRERNVAQASGVMPVLRETPATAKIKILVTGNPRREGGEPFSHWKKRVKNGLTVQEFIDNGGSWMHRRADVARGFITLV